MTQVGRSWLGLLEKTILKFYYSMHHHNSVFSAKEVSDIPKPSVSR